MDKTADDESNKIRAGSNRTVSSPKHLLPAGVDRLFRLPLHGTAEHGCTAVLHAERVATKTVGTLRTSASLGKAESDMTTYLEPLNPPRGRRKSTARERVQCCCRLAGVVYSPISSRSSPAPLTAHRTSRRTPAKRHVPVSPRQTAVSASAIPKLHTSLQPRHAPNKQESRKLNPRIQYGSNRAILVGIFAPSSSIYFLLIPTLVLNRKQDDVDLDEHRRNNRCSLAPRMFATGFFTRIAIYHYVLCSLPVVVVVGRKLGI